MISMSTPQNQATDTQQAEQAMICLFVPRQFMSKFGMSSGFKKRIAFRLNELNNLGSTAPMHLSLEACRAYSRRRGFTITEEVIVFVDDSEPSTKIMQDIESLFPISRPVNVILATSDSPDFQDLDGLESMFQHWQSLGVVFHSPEGGPLDKYELIRFLLTDPLGHHTDSVRCFVPMLSPPRCASARRRVGGGGGTLQAPASALPSTMSGWTSPPIMANVPLSTREGPLPHDGLFLRRNNAFGTKSTFGIKDMIDQGVLIEQTQIRFDDFVVGNTDQVPAPSKGETLALSHGSVALQGNYKAHNATTHFLEIALRAASRSPGDEPPQESLPVNFVFVVDISGSMSGEKLDTVKTAIRELYTQLRDTDVIGIVTFDTRVRTVLKATPKGQLSQEDFTKLISTLRAEGGTDINMGVQYGIDEISRYSSQRFDLVNCLYLFSDGDPTSGETNWINIRTNIAAKVRDNMTISCFGFGSDAQIRELDALAGLTGGQATFVIQPEDVRLNLSEDLTRREHLAAINIQLQIEIDAAIKVWHLYGHDQITDPATRAAVEEQAHSVKRKAHDQYGVDSLPDLITQEKGIRIFAPDLAFGETYWIVLELELPEGREQPGFGAATVQYVDTTKRTNQRHELALTESGTIPTNVVLTHGIGLWTSEVTFYALDDLYQNDRATAKTRLSNHLHVLASAHAMVAAPQFVDDQVTFRKLISLTENLGKPIAWGEGGHGGSQAYMIHAMNSFGHVRGGFVKSRNGTV